MLEVFSELTFQGARRLLINVHEQLEPSSGLSWKIGANLPCNLQPARMFVFVIPKIGIGVDYK